MHANLHALDHPGILIITRRIDDCNDIVEQINDLANINTAAAYHSQAKIKLSDLSYYPVVVITHKAYEIALDCLGNSSSIKQTWPYFHKYQAGTRKLVVIDECIDLVESNQAGLEGLRQTLAAIPQHIREKYENDVLIVQGIIEVLETFAALPKSSKDPIQETMLVNGNNIFRHTQTGIKFNMEGKDISGLIDAMGSIRFDLQIGKDDPRECLRLRQKHVRCLKDLQYILQSWRYYSGVENGHTLHTARLLVPEGTKGAVVFDATATSNVIYELHQDSQIITAPDGTRNYQNVTLHVSRGHKVGKNYMRDNAKKLCGEMMSELNPLIAKDTQALVICHKDVEPHLNKYEPTFDMKTAHWGAIDGSNDWKDCNTAVIFGLPYRPDFWTADVYMALQEPTSTEWLQDSKKRAFGKHSDIRKAIKHGQIASDVIQAINRVRCRKVVDTEGNCDETHIYMLLPEGPLSDDLIVHIEKQMPNIRIAEWNYTGQRKKPKASKHEASFLKYTQNMEPECKVNVGHVGKALGISTSTMKRLKSKARDPESPLYMALKESNVSLTNERVGQTQKTHLIKN